MATTAIKNSENGAANKITVPAKASSEPVEKGAIVRKKNDILANYSLDSTESLSVEFGADKEFESFLTSQEEISRQVELAKLEKIEAAKARGIRKAHQQIIVQRQTEKDSYKKRFIEHELPGIIDSYVKFMPFESMKTVIDKICDLIEIKLDWEENEDGEFKCTPRI